MPTRGMKKEIKNKNEHKKIIFFQNKTFYSISLFLLILISVLLTIGIIDFLELDSLIAEKIFKINYWDLSFYSFVSIIISASVPIAGLWITNSFQNKNTSEYKLKKMSKFISSLYEAHNYAMYLFSPLQNIPKDIQERKIFERERYSKITLLYNNLSKEYGEVSMIIIKNKIIQKYVDSYFLLLRQTLISWHMVNIEEIDDLYKDYIKTEKKYRDEAEKLISEIKTEGFKLLQNDT